MSEKDEDWFEEWEKKSEQDEAKALSELIKKHGVSEQPQQVVSTSEQKTEGWSVNQKLFLLVIVFAASLTGYHFYQKAEEERGRIVRVNRCIQENCPVTNNVSSSRRLSRGENDPECVLKCEKQYETEESRQRQIEECRNWDKEQEKEMQKTHTASGTRKQPKPPPYRCKRFLRK